MKLALFVASFFCAVAVYAQPGPSSIRVYFNLPAPFSKQYFPERIHTEFAIYLNGQQKWKKRGSVTQLSMPNEYEQEVVNSHVYGHDSGFDLFDSVAFSVTINGTKYQASSKTSAITSLFVQDFSGEYSTPIIPFSSYSVPTRYPFSRPQKQELITTIQQLKKRKTRYNAPYLIVLNSDQKRIGDALVICNGDTLNPTDYGLYHPENWISGKARIEVYHPDYPSLVLDSCVPTIQTVYLLKEHEPYYVDAGVKHPLKDRQTEKIAVRFAVGTPPQVMDSCLLQIEQNQHYKVVYHYPDSLKVHNEMIYGGVADLSRIVLLERKSPSTLGNTYKRQFDYFKDTFPIDGIFRPVTSSIYLNNTLTVVYKPETTPYERKKIEKDFLIYGKEHPYPSNAQPHYVEYLLDVFITPNYLVKQLMKNEHVQNVFIGKIEYTTFG